MTDRFKTVSGVESVPCQQDEYKPAISYAACTICGAEAVGAQANRPLEHAPWCEPQYIQVRVLDAR